MSAAKSLERIEELINEIRALPLPESPEKKRLQKICDDLDFVYNCALMPYEQIDIALADLESENRDLEDRIESLEARLGGKP